MHGRVRGRRTTRKRTSLAAVVCRHFDPDHRRARALGGRAISDRAASSGSRSPTSTTSIRRSSYTGRRLGDHRHDLRASHDLPRQAAAGGLPSRARGRRGLSEDLTQRQDVHVHAAARLPLQRRHTGSCQRVRTRDQPHARAWRWRRQAGAVHREHRRRRRRPVRQGRRRRAGSRHAATRSSFASHAPSPTSRQ